MVLTQDFKELLTLFVEKKVKFLVVGGYAVNHYGYPRYTHDIDLLIWMDKCNAVGASFLKKVSHCLTYLKNNKSS